jgi:hypothetical protein
MMEKGYVGPKKLGPKDFSRLDFWNWKKEFGTNDAWPIFRDKKRGFILGVIRAYLDGYDGRVTCYHYFEREKKVDLSYTVLEPLSDMEVIAYAAALGA